MLGRPVSLEDFYSSSEGLKVCSIPSPSSIAKLSAIDLQALPKSRLRTRMSGQVVEGREMPQGLQCVYVPLRPW